MTRPRITLVVNPAANKGIGYRTGAQVASRLAASADVQVRSAGSAAGSVALLASAAIGADAVFVCGGDGIVHLAANALAGGQVPLGIIPAGTGNDTATALGSGNDPLRAADALLAALAANSVTRVDLGSCDAPSLTDAAGRWWITMCYAGFDSAVNERANRMRWPRGPRSYDVAIVAELAALRPRWLRLTLDGVSQDLAVTLVAIGNGPQYGGGKLITPDARMDDGYFDVTVVGPVNRRQLARLAPTLPRAGHIGHPAVSRHRARTVGLQSLTAEDQLTAYADGERLGPLPLSTRCVPSALPVLVPVGATPSGLSNRSAPRVRPEQLPQNCAM